MARPTGARPTGARPTGARPTGARPTGARPTGIGTEPDSLAERVAATVTAHPAVARLDGGMFGSVATHLPGRRLVGVRIGQGAEPVELGVVVRLSSRIPDVVADLRRDVSALCGGAAVDITVSDVDVPAIAVGPPAPPVG